MTSPSANDIDANNNANNANANSVVSASQASGSRENANGRIGRIRVPPLLIIDEDDALPTGFAPFETETFRTIVDRINPLMTPISLNNN